MKEPVQPPNILYHGTAHRFMENIIAMGVISIDRQYVHLSEDTKVAIAVGKRRDGDPVVCKIDAKQAWDDGVLFYLGNEDIWLANDIPAKYCAVTTHADSING